MLAMKGAILTVVLLGQVAQADEGGACRVLIERELGAYAKNRGTHIDPARTVVKSLGQGQSRTTYFDVQGNEALSYKASTKYQSEEQSIISRARAGFLTEFHLHACELADGYLANPVFIYPEGADPASDPTAVRPELCTNFAQLGGLVQDLPLTEEGLQQSLCESRGGIFKQSFLNKLQKRNTKECRCPDGSLVEAKVGMPGDKTEGLMALGDPAKAGPQRSCKPVLEREPSTLDKAVALLYPNLTSYSDKEFASLLPLLQGKAPQLAQLCELHSASWKKLMAARQLEALKRKPPLTFKLDGEQYVRCTIAEVNGDLIGRFGLSPGDFGKYVILRDAREKSAGYAPLQQVQFTPYSKYPPSAFEKMLATLQVSLDCNNVTEVLGGEAEASVAAGDKGATGSLGAN